MRMNIFTPRGRPRLFCYKKHTSFYILFNQIFHENLWKLCHRRHTRCPAWPIIFKVRIQVEKNLKIFESDQEDCCNNHLNYTPYRLKNPFWVFLLFGLMSGMKNRKSLILHLLYNLSLFNIRCREYRSIYLFSSVRRGYPRL